jgi:DNA-binding XRE family transcriptional regulator
MAKKGGRRGGRKPGEWKLVKPEQLREYRATNKVSRARLAQMLGVSSTSVQNWETDTVATMKIQQRLAELFAAGPAAILPRMKQQSPWQRDAGEGNSVLSATGTIVASYVKARSDVGADELVGLIKSVRSALS